MAFDPVIVLYNELSTDAARDELDVLDQVGAVSDTLTRLGFTVSNLAFSANIIDCANDLLQMKPQLVFNLVESVYGEGRLSHLAAALLENLHIRYTGCPAASIQLTTNKVATKKKMKSLGIPTPPWVSPSESDGFIDLDTYIVKVLDEDASIGISQESIMNLSGVDEARQVLSELKSKSGRDWFAEKYIDGREYSVPIVGKSGRPRVLTPTEIQFKGYSENNLNKIWDYRAKWDVDSYEYKNAVAVNCSRREDTALIKQLEAVSVKCWDNFGLRGYARIDFRVDRKGRPWVLEINANPCITPGCGFIQSAKESGLTYSQLIERIMLEAGNEECCERSITV